MQSLKNTKSRRWAAKSLNTATALSVNHIPYTFFNVKNLNVLFYRGIDDAVMDTISGD